MTINGTTSPGAGAGVAAVASVLGSACFGRRLIACATTTGGDSTGLSGAAGLGLLSWPKETRPQVARPRIMSWFFIM